MFLLSWHSAFSLRNKEPNDHKLNLLKRGPGVDFFVKYFVTVTWKASNSGGNARNKGSSAEVEKVPVMPEAPALNSSKRRDSGPRQPQNGGLGTQLIGNVIHEQVRGLVWILAHKQQVCLLTS